jgi:hypothetical protein
MAGEVDAKGASFQLGAVKPLFVAFAQDSAMLFDVRGDGKRCVIVSVPEQSSPITVLVNWPAGLKP